MISHDRAQQLISARMDAPLISGEHHELHGHLATCESCRAFVTSADDLARGLQVLPRLAPSPAVSRAVMAAVRTESSGWDWLRQGLQALSSPGMAVASGLALVVALAGAMIVALTVPGGGDGTGADPEGSIAAVTDAPLPMAIPTEIPAPEPTASRVAERTISAPPTQTPKETPPRPTATRVPAAAIAAPTAVQVENAPIEPATVAQPLIEAAAEQPALALAPDDGAAAPPADLAQAVDEPAPSDEVAAAPELAPEAAVAAEPAPAENAPESNDNGRRGDGSRKNNIDGQVAPADAAVAPVATEPLPVPDEAIAALENAGASPNDLTLPPAPVLPMPPSQAFLPITPTPVTDGTPTPETVTQAEAPQLADEWSGELAVTALMPEAPDATIVESEEITAREKRDKSSKEGKSNENQQSATNDGAMGWSMSAIELPQDAVSFQTTDDAAATVTPADTSAVATTDTAATDTTTATDTTIDDASAVDPAPQYDPVTGYQIDATTGLLIDPVNGYLLDLVNGLVYHPGTGYQVHPFTGLLIDPVTGAQLDPVTLAIVIPAGFGSDQPAYLPGDDAMRGLIEDSVDETYDNATYKVIPPTDGPVQPVGEIVVPTTSGDALEIID